MRSLPALLVCLTTLTPAAVLAQPPQSSSDMIPPSQGAPGIRVAPAQSTPMTTQPSVAAQVPPPTVAQSPVAQPPPPPPPEQGPTPWGTPVAPQPYVMQAPPGYVLSPSMAYGAPMVMPPALIPYDGGPVPAGAQVVTRSRSGLIGGGAAMFGSAWLLSIVLATTSGIREDGGESLAIPVIGPLIAGGAMRGVSSSGWMVLILDTLVQSGGLAMFIYGLTHPAQYLRYDVARPAQASRGVRWMLAPGTAAGPGATFALRF